MDKSVWIGIGILVLVVLGFLAFSNMTGNVITGGVVGAMRVSSESFQASEETSCSCGNKEKGKCKLNGGDLDG